MTLVTCLLYLLSVPLKPNICLLGKAGDLNMRQWFRKSHPRGPKKQTVNIQPDTVPEESTPVPQVSEQKETMERP